MSLESNISVLIQGDLLHFTALFPGGEKFSCSLNVKSTVYEYYANFQISTDSQ